MAATKTLTQSESPIATTDSRPVPDPTSLTTQQLSVAIDNVTALFNARLEAMDRAVSLMQEFASRSPTVGEVNIKFEEKFLSLTTDLKASVEFSEAQLVANSNISQERFARIDQQFVERDKRSDQLTVASSTAIAAALQAQKEAAGEIQKSSAAAIAKAEIATSESVKQLQVLFQTSISALSSQIQDVKSRLDKGEGGQTGGRVATEDYRYERGILRDASSDNRGLIFGIVGVAIGVGAIVITIILNLVK